MTSSCCSVVRCAAAREAQHAARRSPPRRRRRAPRESRYGAWVRSGGQIGRASMLTASSASRTAARVLSGPASTTLESQPERRAHGSSGPPARPSGGERVAVPVGDRAPRLDQTVEPLHLDHADRGGDVREPVVEADLVVHVVGARDLRLRSEVTDAGQVLGSRATTMPPPPVEIELVEVERVDAEVADAAGRAPVERAAGPRRSECLGRVLDDGDAVLARPRRGSARGRRGMAEQVDRHDRLRLGLARLRPARRARSTTTSGSRFQLSGLAVDQRDPGPALVGRVGRRDEREVADPDLVARLDARPRSAPGAGRRCPVEMATASSAPTAAARAGLEGRQIGPEDRARRPRTARAAASTSGGPTVGSERRIRGSTSASILPESRGTEEGPIAESVMLTEGRSWLFRPHIGSEADNPAVWRPGCHPPASIGALPPRGQSHVATAGSPAGPLHPRRPGRAP